jgi:Transglycosylase SLT domain
VTRRHARRLAGIGGFLLAALTSALPASAAGLSCAQAAAVAEADERLPPGLLLAIGNVESGRIDAMGMRTPWPWTINAGGMGRFFASADEAVSAVQALRAGGMQSIDIGCFQINLFHHPDAFPDLASGFDPLTNALAAARFLVSLHQELGAWEPAIAAYHSRADTLGAPYRDRVLASWHGAPAASGEVTFAGIHVWGPSGEIGFGAWSPSLGSRSVAAGPSRVRLPRVVTVSVR